jgi:cyclopropane-fatty-acyl-phospholipid synthase
METAEARTLTSARKAPGLRWRERLLVRFLRRLKGGAVELRLPSGVIVVAGEEGHVPLPLEIRNEAFFGKVFGGGSVGFGEAYVDGDWSTQDLPGLLELLGRNEPDLGRLGRGFSALSRALNRLYHRARRNTPERSRENISEHYDLSNDFYATFLDAGMTYSSALFHGPEDTLEQGQRNKINRMLDLSSVSEGSRLLEIGSGWGSLALAAAERGCGVKTVTLSREQYDYASERFTSAGCGERIDVALEDYRRLEGAYDAVVSCEMIEAVGHEYLEEYFRVVRRCLKPGGRAVIQVITIPDERYERYRRSCDWIQKHIFPGGHLPSPGALGEAIRTAEDLEVERVDAFGQDYAETLRLWRERFNAGRDAVLALGFDEAFRRKWNYYFAYCEAGFRAGLIDVQHWVLRRTGA